MDTLDPTQLKLNIRCAQTGKQWHVTLDQLSDALSGQAATWSDHEGRDVAVQLQQDTITQLQDNADAAARRVLSTFSDRIGQIEQSITDLQNKPEPVPLQPLDALHPPEPDGDLVDRIAALENFVSDNDGFVDIQVNLLTAVSAFEKALKRQSEQLDEFRRHRAVQDETLETLKDTFHHLWLDLSTPKRIASR